MLDNYGIAYKPVEPEAVAPHIAAGKVIGWFEGGSEFGPRALGIDRSSRIRAIRR